MFISYGIPKELSTDGGPQFMSTAFQNFLTKWGVTHWLSSVAYPQSNDRAELDVKTTKIIINDNVSHQGGTDNDQVAKALLQYWNTLLPYIKLSPAQLLLHRNLRDHIPRNEKYYHLHQEWLSTATEYEKAPSEKHEDILNQYNQSSKELPEIPVGSSVNYNDSIKPIEQQTPSPTISPRNNNVKPHHDINPQQNIPCQPKINPPNNITRLNTDTTLPALQIPKRMPQDLKCLADFNNPGLNEQ